MKEQDTVTAWPYTVVCHPVDITPKHVNVIQFNTLLCIFCNVLSDDNHNRH